VLYHLAGSWCGDTRRDTQPRTRWFVNYGESSVRKRAPQPVNRPPTSSSKVVFSPQALRLLVAGFDDLASLLAVTLGPSKGSILNSREDGSVEILSDAGTIARRIVEVPGRCQNTGAMFLRNLSWRMHEQYGDGAATAAVLARAIVRESVKRIEAGVDPVLIRGGLELGLTAAIAELERQAVLVNGVKTLTAVATSMSADPELGGVLAEIVEILGPSAAISIEEYPISYLDREYVEGAYWRAHPASRSTIPEGQTELVLDDPLIMLVDQEIIEVEDILGALELAANVNSARKLLIVAPKVADQVLQAIALNQSRGTVTVAIAVLSSIGLDLTIDLTDMGILTGGCVLGDVKGASPRRVQSEQLGSARRAILNRDSLTIVAGGSDPMAIDERKAEAERQLARTSLTGKEREELQKRLARLNGGIAILKIGARTGMELTNRRGEAEKIFRALTGLVNEGVVPGGGVAFLQCINAVSSARYACSLPGQEHGVDVLVEALKAPFLQLVSNHSSKHPALALEDARQLGVGFGFDVLTGKHLNMLDEGIVDSLQVAKGALQSAVSAAIALLTTSVVILPANRELQAKP
jgi:chaperonin GroEL